MTTLGMRSRRQERRHGPKLGRRHNERGPHEVRALLRRRRLHHALPAKAGHRAMRGMSRKRLARLAIQPKRERQGIYATQTNRSTYAKCERSPFPRFAEPKTSPRLRPQPNPEAQLDRADRLEATHGSEWGEVEELKYSELRRQLRNAEDRIARLTRPGLLESPAWRPIPVLATERLVSASELASAAMRYDLMGAAKESMRAELEGALCLGRGTLKDQPVWCGRAIAHDAWRLRLGVVVREQI